MTGLGCTFWVTLISVIESANRTNDGKNGSTMPSIQNLPLFDAAEYLDSEADIAEYLAVVVDEDIAMLPIALGTVARARGMTALARETGLSRESLYRALSEHGNPTLDTLVKVLSAYRVKLSLQPKPRPVDA